MHRLLTGILLVGGVGLLILGVQATNAFMADVSRFFTSSPTDKGIWMILGGTVAALAGFTMTMQRARQR